MPPLLPTACSLVCSALPRYVARRHCKSALSRAQPPALKKTSEQIEERLSVKRAYIHEYGSTTRYQHLRRERMTTETACCIQPNPKYVEAAAELLGLADSKAVTTPTRRRRSSGLGA